MKLNRETHSLIPDFVLEEEALTTEEQMIAVHFYRYKLDIVKTIESVEDVYKFSPESVVKTLAKLWNLGYINFETDKEDLEKVYQEYEK